MTTTAEKPDRLDTANPPVLVAILVAARQTGDRLLESIARRELEERHGIRLSFGRRPVKEVVANV